MIKNLTVAREISDLMIEFGARLDSSIRLVADECSPDELQVYRKAVGTVLGEILLGIMNPLYTEHPSLKPPELN